MSRIETAQKSREKAAPRKPAHCPRVHTGLKAQFCVFHAAAFHPAGTLGDEAGSVLTLMLLKIRAWRKTGLLSVA